MYRNKPSAYQALIRNVHLEIVSKPAGDRDLNSNMCSAIFSFVWR